MVWKIIIKRKQTYCCENTKLKCSF